MKYSQWIILSLFVAASINGCKKADSNPADGQTPTVVLSEVWQSILDGDTTKHGEQIFEKFSDGSLRARGTWYYFVTGDEVKCTYSNAVMTVTDSVFVCSGNGTATNPGAYTGNQNSPFTFVTTGVAKNDTAYGTFIVHFSAVGWPTEIQGTFTSSKVNGSGITQ